MKKSKNVKEQISYWIDIAEYDLKTAKVMLEGKRYLYVGFMCHQVIEKMLKSYYAKVKRNTPPYTHNLLYLCKQSGLDKELSEEQVDFIDTVLQPLNIHARYPKYKEELLETLSAINCKRILTKTRKLYKWLKEKLLTR